MNIRLRKGVVCRGDSFGGICYVSSRNDFFAANTKVYRLITELSRNWTVCSPEEEVSYKAIARVGICETIPETIEEAYSGPSTLGIFREAPVVSDPLVVNCFSTSHCPLRCFYCHADDLMQGYRENESRSDLQNVVATASAIPAIVAVVTGGDPLSAPDRAKYLLESLTGKMALVLDTSGVGNIDSLVPVLVRNSVHVRVSLDCISFRNSYIRPGNNRYGHPKDASLHGAKITIQKCLDAGLPVTVQTVISSRNENPDDWEDLRDWLVKHHVRHWVLHLAVIGGSARRIASAAKSQDVSRRILPGPNVRGQIRNLIGDTVTNKYPIDIRCTDADMRPNSVLLVGSTGDLYTEGGVDFGKVKIYGASDTSPGISESIWAHVDRVDHSRRYFNLNPWLFGETGLDESCMEIPLGAMPPNEPQR